MIGIRVPSQTKPSMTQVAGGLESWPGMERVSCSAIAGSDQVKSCEAGGGGGAVGVVKDV